MYAGENIFTVLFEKLLGKLRVKDRCVGGKIPLDLKKWNGSVWIELAWLGVGTNGGILFTP
jgi:hypothetical protein